MKTSATSLLSMARELFEQEWQKAEREGKASQSMTTPMWLLSDLVALVTEMHDRSVRQLTPMIRRFVLEREFVEENGDNVIDPQEMHRMELLVEVLVKVLEQVRQEAIRQGYWSSAPVTPLMCG